MFCFLLINLIVCVGASSRSLIVVLGLGSFQCQGSDKQINNLVHFDLCNFSPFPVHWHGFGDSVHETSSG